MIVNGTEKRREKSEAVADPVWGKIIRRLYIMVKCSVMVRGLQVKPF